MTALLPLTSDILLKATMLLAAAALADALARRASAATRHLLWALSLAGLLALPLAAAALPTWQVRIPVARAAVTANGLATAEDLNPAAVMPHLTSAVDRTVFVSSASDGPAASSSASLGVSLFAVYLIGVLLSLMRLLFDSIQIRRLARDASALEDGEWRGLLSACAGDLGVGRRVRLLRSAREVTPLTFGSLAPVIVVPASADGWAVDRRRAVLLHELAHVARYDCFVQRLTALAAVIYWPHPGLWWAAHRLRVERELACDDRVVAAGAGPREYAAHLLELARTLSACPAPATALGMSRARRLEGRLLAILDATRNRAALRAGAVTASLVTAAAVLVPIAIVRAAIVPVAPVSSPSQAAAVPSAAAGGQDFTGTWELRRTQNPDAFQVTIRTEHGTRGRTVQRDRLAGLPLDQIDSASANVHVPIRREAGTFTVDGVCRRGLCGGTFVFTADPAFADALVKRGIGRPTAGDQFALAIADAGLVYVDALAVAGYPKPDLQTLVRAAQHGVGMEYLRGMTALGYRAGTLDALITLRDHGVGPEYIRGMEAAGYGHLSTDELRTARDHGVDPAFARDMAAVGFPGLSLSVLTNARDHGVDPEYVRGMQAMGQRLTLDQYFNARNHGVDPEYIRGMQGLGYRGLGIDALLSARDHGVDPGYVREMAELGYTGVALGDLIRLRDHGVDPAFVHRVQRNGAPHLSVDEIIRRRDTNR